jgi:hypothetical protein
MSLGLRLTSDGTPAGTQLITPDGFVLPTKSIRFTHHGDELPVMTLTIELVGVEFDFAARQRTATIAKVTHEVTEQPQHEHYDSLVRHG